MMSSNAINSALSLSTAHKDHNCPLFHFRTTAEAKKDEPETFYYRNGETLPGKKEIQSPQGDLVHVTADMWLKQQQKQNEKF